MDCPAGTKTSGRCRQVAVSAGSTEPNGKFYYVLPEASILRAEVSLLHGFKRLPSSSRGLFVA